MIKGIVAVWEFCVGEPKGWGLDLSVKEQKAIKGG
jgi:hypothetical protein